MRCYLHMPDERGSLPRPTDQTLDATVVGRYVAGESSPFEQVAIARWGTRHLGEETALRLMREDGAREWRSVDPADEKAVEALVARVTEPGMVPTVVVGTTIRRTKDLILQQTVRRTGFRPLWRVVAGGVVATALFLALMIVHHSDAGHNPGRVFQTTSGARTTVHFHDGSTMVLAPSTRVTVTGGEIDVAGEAYFDIVPRASRPLVVRTSGAIVRVLGTSFAVRHYPEDRSTRVVVDRGRVSIAPSHHANTRLAPSILTARMLAQVTDSSVTVSSAIVPRDYISWTRDTLVFKGTTLGDVATALARAYGVEIHISESTLAHSLVHLEVSLADDPIDQVLQTLCHVTNAHMTGVGGRYTLSPGRAALPAPHAAPARHHLLSSESQYGL